MVLISQQTLQSCCRIHAPAGQEAQGEWACGVGGRVPLGTRGAKRGALRIGSGRIGRKRLLSSTAGCNRHKRRRSTAPAASLLGNRLQTASSAAMRSPCSVKRSTVCGSLVPPSQEKKHGNEDIKPKKKESSRGLKMTNAPFLIKLVVLSILACPSHAIDLVSVPEPFGRPKGEQSQLCFSKWDVETQQYSSFSKTRELNIRAKEKIAANGPSVLPVLLTAPLAPPQWQLQGLFSSRTGDETVVALRLDNLDLVGFTNKTGHWHTFEGLEYLIPGSVGLGFKNDYDSLIGGHMELISKVDLSKSAILGILPVTSNHDPNTADVDVLKLSLAKLKVVTSETQKFTRIHDQVNLGWQGTEPSFMRQVDAEKVLMWVQISEAIVFWKDTGSWELHAHSLNQAGINSAQGAMYWVRMVCRPGPSTKS